MSAIPVPTTVARISKKVMPRLLLEKSGVVAGSGIEDGPAILVIIAAAVAAASFERFRKYGFVDSIF